MNNYNKINGALAVAALSLIMLALSACGGDSDPTVVAAQTPAPVAAAPLVAPPAITPPTTSTNPVGSTPPAACTKSNAKVGRSAVLVTKGHGVTGTATVIDDCTIEIKNFSYDGGGLPDVFVYGGKGGDYKAGFPIGPNLFGTRRTNETIQVTLKVGELDALDGISIWCVGAGVSFGDGLFN
jgi:Electron transfer DM13